MTVRRAVLRPLSLATVLTTLLLVVAAGSAAQAQIVYFPVSPAQSITGNALLTFGSINLSNGTFSLINDNPPSFGIGSTSGTDNTLFAQDNNSIQWALTPGSGTGQGLGQIARYAAQASISSSIADWSSADPNLFTSDHSQNWYATGTGYAGLRIDAGSGNYNYGWVSIAYDTANSTATISGFAFENQVNTAIPAAAIPEPGTGALALVAAATVLVAGWRRARRS